MEDIEFPGFRRSNQFVAIRAAVDSSLPWASFYESNPPPPSAKDESQSELVFAQPSKLKPEICTFDTPVANLISSTRFDPPRLPRFSIFVSSYKTYIAYAIMWACRSMIVFVKLGRLIPLWYNFSYEGIDVSSSKISYYLKHYITYCYCFLWNLLY